MHYLGVEKAHFRAGVSVVVLRFGLGPRMKPPKLLVNVPMQKGELPLSEQPRSEA